jgi:hypothetical protein
MMLPLLGGVVGNLMIASWSVWSDASDPSDASGLLVSIDVRPETLLTRERLVLFPKALVVPLVEAIVPFPEAMDLGFSGALIHLRLVEGHLL